MIDLKNMKIIHLFDKLETSDKRSIVNNYYKTKIAELGGAEIDSQIDRIEKKYLECYYKRLLGESWKILVEKYEIPKQNICLVSEKLNCKEPNLDSIFFNSNHFSPGSLVYFSKTEYPYLCNKYNDIVEKFGKCKCKRELVSLLYEKIFIQNKFIQNMISKGDIMTKFSYLPNINTYGELRNKYPEIFEIHIQEILKTGFDSLQLIKVDDEIKTIKKFLEC